MAADLYTKIVLGVVAVCLLLLVAQGFGLASRPACPMESEPAGAAAQARTRDRFRIVPVPMGRVAFRINTETGRTWKMPFPAGTAWTRVEEAEESASAPEPEEAPPAEAEQEGPGS